MRSRSVEQRRTIRSGYRRSTGFLVGRSRECGRGLPFRDVAAHLQGQVAGNKTARNRWPEAWMLPRLLLDHCACRESWCAISVD